MKLRDIQLGMARALRVPEPLRQHEREHAFAAQIARGNDRLAPVDQLDIYREQFTIRHLDALAEDFEAVRAVLGGRVFDHLASRFLVERPPDMVSLNDLGRDFPAYIAAAELPHQPLVAELARLDWAFVEAYFARDRPPLDPARLEAARARLDDAVVVFDDTLSLHRFAYPVHLLRHAIAYGESWALPDPRPSAVVVHRQNLVLAWKELDELELAALEALGDGRSLGAALDALAAARPTDAARLEENIGSYFCAWVEDGWVRDVVLDDGKPA